MDLAPGLETISQAALSLAGRTGYTEGETPVMYTVRENLPPINKIG